MPPKNRFAELLPEITAWRHDFHQHPELLFDVHRTAARSVWNRTGANYAHARMAGAQLSIGWPPDAEAAGEGLVGAVLVRQGYPTGTGEMLV